MVERYFRGKNHVADCGGLTYLGNFPSLVPPRAGKKDRKRQDLLMKAIETSGPQLGVGHHQWLAMAQCS